MALESALNGSYVFKASLLLLASLTLPTLPFYLFILLCMFLEHQISIYNNTFWRIMQHCNCHWDEC